MRALGAPLRIEGRRLVPFVEESTQLTLYPVSYLVIYPKGFGCWVERSMAEAMLRGAEPGTIPQRAVMGSLPRAGAAPGGISRSKIHCTP